MQEIIDRKFSDIVKWTPKQDVANDAVSKYKYILYGGAMGGGKAIPINEYIAVPDGFSTMGNIKTGDFVIGRDGLPKKVLGETPIQERECYKITFQDGREAICSDKHLWNITISSSRIKNRLMDADEIYRRMRTRKIRGKSYSYPLIELTEPVEYSENDLELHPYLVGVLIGDGGLTQGTGIITTDDEEMIDRIKSFGYKVTKIKSKYGYRVWGGKKVIPRELVGKKSEDKFIPYRYASSSIKHRWELMKGLMDTDGYIDIRGHCSFSTSSNRLAKDFQHLSWSLGFIATIQLKKTERLDNYVIHLSGKDTLKLFSIKRKLDRIKIWNNGDGTPKLRIISMEKVGRKKVKCIEVEDGEFLLEDYIVTHNSYWLRWELIKLLIYYYAKYGLENVTVGLFCEDYPALKDRHLGKIKFEFPEWLGDYSGQDHNFVLKPRYGGGVLAFRNLDDVSKYQSAEFAAEGVDELTKNAEEIFIFLRTRLRWPGIPTFDTKFVAGTNPGGIGHAWVKRRWIDKIFEENEQEKELFYFIPAKAVDNPYLDKGYYASLESLPDPLKKAFLDGDWDLFQGQYFSEWRRDIHTCAPFNPSADWVKFICIDYGYAKPAAAYWCAISPDGTIYVYRELYKTGLTYSALTKEIVALTPNNEEIKYWVIDPSAWIKGKERDTEAISGAEIMESIYKEVKKKSLMLLKGNNDRINGWRAVRECLKPIMNGLGDVIAKLQVFNTCPELIRTLPSLIFDQIKVEDLDTDGEDHAADAVRYGIMSRPVPSKTQEQVLDDFFKKKMKNLQVKTNKPFSMTGY